MNKPATPKTPTMAMPIPKRSYGRSLANFDPLLPAEKILLNQSAQGKVAEIGNVVPADNSDYNKIVRASFLRFLLLGGDEQAPVHEQGVQLIGAWIQGLLDLENCLVPRRMALALCKFDEQIIARDAHIAGLLVLSGSHLIKGLSADRLRSDSGVFLRDGFRSFAEINISGAHIEGNLDCSTGQFETENGYALTAEGAVIKGNVFLKNEFKAKGEVRLLGTEIGSNLECSGGQFEAKSGNAFCADSAVINGSVFLNKKFKATGEVRLFGAQIGGDLKCSGGQFEPKEGYAFSVDGIVVQGNVLLNEYFKATGGVRLLGAQIGGDLDCSGGEFSPDIKDVLLLQTATIQNGFVLRALTNPVQINATSTHIGVLVDERNTWAKGSTLNGLVYRSLAGNAPTDAAHRISWLKQQHDEDLGVGAKNQSFRPQPWKQLQKVLREMGHEADAREVGIAFENQLRIADRIGQISDANKAKNIMPFMRRICLRSLHWLFGVLAGYGYRPMRLFMIMVAIWLLCALAYWLLALEPNSALGPTDPLVFQHPDYAACTAASKGNWFLCGPLPAEYTTFSPLAYSLDILLPLVDLGQEKSWGPLVPTPKQTIYGEFLSFSAAHFVRLLNWFEILFGWIASLLFVAIVSGMSQRSEIEK